MFKSTAFLVLVLGCVSPSFGEVCHGIGGGMVVCPDSGDSGQNEAARAQRADDRRLQERSKRLDECLRKSDWPGQPGRAECRRLFGAD